MVLDGSDAASRRLESMLFWDVNNASPEEAGHAMRGQTAIEREMQRSGNLKVTLPNLVDDAVFVRSVRD